MALGARPGVVGWMVVREGLALALPGLLAGLVVALAAARLVGGMLVEVDAADPLTFGVSALLLGAVAALASYLPALRATRVEPMSALRG
jgi:ABC-type antimicrobial peptide transport system permease subunit